MLIVTIMAMTAAVSVPQGVQCHDCEDKGLLPWESCASGFSTKHKIIEVDYGEQQIDNFHSGWWCRSCEQAFAISEHNLIIVEECYNGLAASAALLLTQPMEGFDAEIRDLVNNYPGLLVPAEDHYAIVMNNCNGTPRGEVTVTHDLWKTL